MFKKRSKNEFEKRKKEKKHRNTGGPRYLRTFYLRFHLYVIKIMAFQRNASSNLPMLLVSLYANSLYAIQFLGPYLSHIMTNEGRLYYYYAIKISD